ncbi:MAG: hypothetical protein PF961_20335 [Planctomycetota bacterium]|jgi:hypothetical protein|nr:hypothetical protein [Planctomycetota bacterium]
MPINNPWPYYRMTVKEILSVRSFIEFTTDNAKSHGQKFSELIILMGVEIETLLRGYAGSSKSRPNMNDYKSAMNDRCPGVINIQIRSLHYDTEKVRQPFPHLSQNDSYDWWDTYTGLKHDRYLNSKSATLENTFIVLAAYFAVAMIASHEDSSLFDQGQRVGGFFTDFEHRLAESNRAFSGGIDYLNATPQWRPSTGIFGKPPGINSEVQ